jgi:hypothetical protein
MIEVDPTLGRNRRNTWLTTPESVDIAAEFGPLVAKYRDRCLWFLREDFVPGNVAEANLALDHIEKYGDREAFVEARRLRQWLLQVSNANSAG